MVPVGSWLFHYYIDIKRTEYEELSMDLTHRSIDDPIKLPLEWVNVYFRKLDNFISVDSADDASELEYHKVAVKGRFDHDKEIYIKDKWLKTPFSVIHRSKLKTYNPYDYSEPEYKGYHVITPFILDSGEQILVNRGWVDEAHLDPKTRTSGQISGSVEVTGLLKNGENVS